MLDDVALLWWRMGVVTVTTGDAPLPTSWAAFQQALSSQFRPPNADK